MTLGTPGQESSHGEDPAYLSEGLLTCIGNKRALLRPIEAAVEKVKARLGKPKLRILDAFAGSGAVSRLFKSHASLLASNDLEEYAAAVARCHLTNRSAVDLDALRDAVHGLDDAVRARNLPTGFIEELYAPRDDDDIQPGERAFYTRENARRLDDYRRLLDPLPEQTRTLLMGPLLSRASVHANTSGVFKGFHKDRATGIGRFGGSAEDALRRIKGEIRLGLPVLSRFECEVEIHQRDANDVVREARGLDLAYFDPPYNQHPYGSNYFMLNLLVRYERPDEISRVSGIPKGWRRSGYNVRSRSLPLVRDLVRSVDAPFVLVSSSDEGFVRPHDMARLLAEEGRVEAVEIPYYAFRGSRNLGARPTRLKEHLFLVEKR